ncbi:H-NS histone family protein [Vibrio sp. ZSDZ65]|uniref:H-NS histone family protein n=1 Tax=Vibrio qingdaonensis TaxID=2829491 RepID=A0A9X3CRZ2_9VIBR|nr:H-NS family nucleoid-associated regulatory protein [Vibrio qingdaonensis]MCW8348701.1 H-NS histone family protein [Vibrio qingdaonensis]
MTDIIKQLTQPRRAKALFKHANIEQLDRILNIVTEIKTEKEHDAQKQAEHEQQERKALEEMREEILNKGLDFDKLVSLMKPQRKAKKRKSTSTKDAPKTYRYGDNKTWNGEGNVPEEMQKMLDEGLELADFLQTE